ncbi:MAG: hypothetical protein M1817_000891 [Caeruleum heppii]|nr:MAG: hypothetical protein M1817_000891 [Caeruleum heppii]
MMKVQRRFGKLLSRTADESQVAVLLKDFDDADKLLAKIIDASKSWRDGWRTILSTQWKLVNEVQGIYSPIPAESDTQFEREYAVTPETTLQRTAALRNVYEELRTDLLAEVNLIDARIIRPAMDAKDSIQPLKKVIKKREDKKLDFERYRGRVDTMNKKSKLSERDTVSLAKAERELERATEEYHVADDRLKSKLPPVVAATFSIVPHLLSSQILIQNTLLAQYYTGVHHYCLDHEFPSPAPPMQEVIAAWDAEFRPVQREIETGINCVSSGKGVRQPMKLEDQTHGSTLTGMNIRNGMAQKRLAAPPVPQKAAIAPAARALPPSPSAAITAKPIPASPSSSLMVLSPPADSGYHTPGAGGSHSPAATRAEYFVRDRLPSSSSASSTVASAAAKKKPPPPVPVKRSSSSAVTYVTALYNFDGENDGDLAFREGDRIRVTKKSESMNDWWEGELEGRQGAFPANYCQVGS